MTSREIIRLVLGIGVGGIIVEIIQAFRQRKKMGADYADVISNAAVRLLEPLERRIKELEDELKETRKELNDARLEVSRLTKSARRAKKEIDDEETP